MENNQAMGLPYVPFTFPTVLFSRLASSLGYSLTYSEVDDLHDAYKDGRDSGDLSQKGNTSEAAAYMSVFTGLSRQKAKQWLETADAAAKTWWNWGTANYFQDFGAPGPVEGLTKNVTDVAKTLGDTVGKTAGAITKGVTNGIAKSLGIPNWIMGLVVTLAAFVALYIIIKIYAPGSSLKKAFS